MFIKILNLCLALLFLFTFTGEVFAAKVECGSANAKYLAILNSNSSELCKSGKVVNFYSGARIWGWSCSEGGSVIGCSAGKLASLTFAISGTCGVSNGRAFFVAPSSGLCNSGNSTMVSGSGPWYWSCVGLNSGNTANCSANKALNGMVNGACGSASGSMTGIMPTSNFCLSGLASSISGSGPWYWSCNGSNKGLNVSCSAKKTINGQCGTSSGANLISTPVANLCLSGSSSVVTGSGPWVWSCTGLNGGTSVNCSAKKMINGQCGVSSGIATGVMPAANLCLSGVASSVFGSGPWYWSCNGSNKGLNVSCSAKKIINGQCGSSDGANLISTPVANLCLRGSSSVVTGSGPWAWSCSGSNGGTNANCSAKKIINGQCGTSSGITTGAMPVTNLCLSGTSSAVVGNGPWTWNCNGLNDGLNVSCSALTNGPYRIPVLVVKYLPVDSSGEKIDKNYTGDAYWLNEGWDSLLTMKEYINSLNDQTINVLESGSKYHFYKDGVVVPNLDYEVVGTLEYLKSMPEISGNGANYDYNAIMEEINAKDWVENKGVKEIWIWGYHKPGTNLNESNMSGPYGDFSNSWYGSGDLPIFSKTYTVYHYNYTRDVGCAVEDHMHQIEAVLKAVDKNMFWDNFVGWYPGSPLQDQKRRAGSAHFTPNGQKDYDWNNQEYVTTDIEDWSPDYSGEKKVINASRWNNSQVDWFVYWMQSLPGSNNNVTYQGRQFNNWWLFVGDFDGAMNARAKLISN